MDYPLLIAIFPQVLLDGIVLGFMYALIALGYTMVYGVLEFINFAHSEIFVVGGLRGGGDPPRSEDSGASSGAFRRFWSWRSCSWRAWLASGLLAVTVERVAYRPLRAAPRLVPLISAIGVSFFLQDAIRLFESLWNNAFNLVYPTMDQFNYRFQLTQTLDVPVKSLVVIAAALLMLWALHLIVNRTKVGKAMRAVAEDQATASLMGINVNRIISLTFLIGGAMGGAAGVLFGVQYSLINPYTGFIPGPQGVYRCGPGRDRKHPGGHDGRPGAGAPGGVRRLLPLPADRGCLRRRVQGHLRLLDPDPDPDLPAARVCWAKS